MNVYNPKFPHGLNPQDLGFGVWMGHSMVLDSTGDNLQYYGQPQQHTAGGLLMDDIIQQQPNPMDLNPTLNNFDGFNGQLGQLGMNAAAVQQQQQHLFNLQQQQQQLQLQNQFNLNNFVNNQDLIMNSSNSNDDDIMNENSNLIYAPDEQFPQTLIYQNYNNIYLNDATIDGMQVNLDNEVAEDDEEDVEDEEEQNNLISDNSNDYIITAEQFEQQQNHLKIQLQQNMKIPNVVYEPSVNQKPRKKSSMSQYVNSNTENSRNSENSTNTKDMAYKKIRPIKRPGLILKTPIAYEGISDPSVIPIQRDGMAVCEKCGAIGVKHSFYTRQRRFCSMACARGFEQDRSYKFYMNNNEINKTNEDIRQLKDTDSSNNSNATSNNNNHKIKMSKINKKYNNDNISSISNNSENDDIEEEEEENTIDEEQHYDAQIKLENNTDNAELSNQLRSIISQENIPQLAIESKYSSLCPQDDRMATIRRKPSEFLNSYDWTPQISTSSKFQDAPVTCFRHAPGFDMWPNILPGIKVEVENTDSDDKGAQITNSTLANIPHSFWVATVLKIVGYKALLRYEGYERDNSHDFWVNLCSAEVHPVGWCATRGKPLIPPKTIDQKYNDWKQFLVKQLSGARTLPSTFYNRINESLKSRFRVGLNLEVVDKNRISQVKVATIHRIVGKRLYVRYYDSPPEDNGFWCHEDSPLIHPVGWATTVGHNLLAPQDYLDRMLAAREMVLEPNENDATMDLFKTNFQFEEYYLEGKTTEFVEHMKLEAIDPLNLSSICVATVMSVLKFGYMMIRIDSYDPDATGADWFCYHEKSPCIFPVGFCASNNIQLTPPKGYDNQTFDWSRYLLQTKSIAASEDLFYRENLNARFQVGMKLECADLMDPRLVCVATIARVVGRLLKVHFDGWEDEYDQWLDCESPDMYPVGWCFLTGYKLEGPRAQPKVQPITKVSPKILSKKKRRIKFKKNENSIKPTTSTRPVSDTTLLTRNATSRLELEQFQQQKQLDEAHKTDILVKKLKIEPKFEEHENYEVIDDFFKVEEDNYNDYDDDSYSDCSNNRLESSKIEDIKFIPCLISGNSMSNNQPINPEEWSCEDVIEFLNKNDCRAHIEVFNTNKVDGKKLLQLKEDDIYNLLRMKVGPALKIINLIQQLTCKLDPAKSRLMKSNLSKQF